MFLHMVWAPGMQVPVYKLSRAARRNRAGTALLQTDRQLVVHRRIAERALANHFDPVRAGFRNGSSPQATPVGGCRSLRGNDAVPRLLNDAHRRTIRAYPLELGVQQ